MGKSNSPKLLLDIDFAKGIPEKSFNVVSRDKGTTTCDSEGLTINNMVFKKTKPVSDRSGMQDNFKTFMFNRHAIETTRRREVFVESRISGAQFFGNTEQPFPKAFDKRVRNMRADLRLCSGALMAVHPQTGLFASYFLTDHVLYAGYGRLPDVCIPDYIDPLMQDECEPCQTLDANSYDCFTFFKDCRYRSFKQNTSERDFRIFQMFFAWCMFCRTNGTDVNNFDLFASWNKRHPFDCDALNRRDYVTWKSRQNYDEYCCFVNHNWNYWLKCYVSWLACTPVDVTSTGGCVQGDCSKKLFGPDQRCSVCPHQFDSGANCYASPDRVSVGVVETYPYQHGAKRNCCCVKPAVFVDAVPVHLTQFCDPLCTTLKVAIGIDRRYGTFNWYLNNQKLLTKAQVGTRMAEEFNLRNNGGYAVPVDVNCVCVGIGTTSWLDCFVPANYNRARTQDEFYNLTALVPLSPLDNYFQAYFNKYGELKPAVPENFATTSTEVGYRLFDQGYVFKVRYLRVFDGASTRDYKSWRTKCTIQGCPGPFAQGPPNGCSCNRDTCTEMYICSDDEDCCDNDCLIDGRNFQIVQSNNDFVDPDPPLAGTVEGQPLNLRLTRRPKLRPWEPINKPTAYGKDPYMQSNGNAFTSC